MAAPRDESTATWAVRWFLRALALLIVRVVYRVRIVGRESVPDEGGVLLLPNHVSYVDSLLVGSTAGRRWVYFVIFEEFLRARVVGPLVRICGVVPVSSTRAKDAVKATTAALREGKVVCLFPEGQITRHGHLNELKKGFELIVRGAGVPVVPVWMDQLWGSVFSFERGRFFFKWPRHVPYRVTLAFGEPIPAKEATTERVRTAFDALAARTLSERPELDERFDFLVLRRLRTDLGGRCLWENGRWLTRAEVRAEAESLACRWRGLPAGEISLCLPSGPGAVLATLAVLLLGRTPVQVPPGHAADVTPELLQKTRAAISRSERLRRRLTAWMPDDCLRQSVPTNAPAVGWDLPDGTRVRLGHRQIIAQLHQLAATNLLRPGDVLFTDLPLTSAFGQTLALWFALTQHVPISHEKLPACTWHATPGDVAEPTPRITTRPGHNAADIPHRGIILSVSQENPASQTSTGSFQAGEKPGALGRLLPGFVPGWAEGNLLVRGPALGTADAVDAGFSAKIDADGFVSAVSGT